MLNIKYSPPEKLRSKNKKELITSSSRPNVFKKSIKPTQENPTGGFVDLAKAVHISNVAVVSPKTGAATRVRIEEKDGKKVRVAVKCGSVL